ncbi:alpha/beta-hydrolase, partial [Atractiella rhizophila]
MDCAYLTVPMNHLNPQPNLTVSLALRRLPATVPPKERKGTLLINPGGPGGSGTSLVARAGLMIHTILEGKYDILGFDPRSVNQTTPGVGCFSDEASANLENYNIASLGYPYEARLYPSASPYLHNSTSNSLTKSEQAAADASEHAFFVKQFKHREAQLAACKKYGNQDMLKSTTTAFVVRDMKWILEALGESEGGLNYWGFSYGTILGATFSAMFPELVNRVVVDGTSDSVTYTNNILDWGISGMDDNEKTYNGFLRECISAGPSRCALAAENLTTSSLHSRIADVSATLLTSPLPVATEKGVGILTASGLHSAIFSALYKPQAWPGLAKAIDEASKGNGGPLWDLSAVGEDDFVHKKWDDNIFHRPLNVGAGLGSRLILCADTAKDVWKDFTIKGFQNYVHKMSKISSWVGEQWSLWMSECFGWDYEPFEAYRGPWTVEDGLRKTKHPVLFIGNTHDPVTPLSAAKSMSKGFGNESATLLIQDGYGHCTSAHPSLCTAK